MEIFVQEKFDNLKFEKKAKQNDKMVQPKECVLVCASTFMEYHRNSRCPYAKN